MQGGIAVPQPESRSQPCSEPWFHEIESIVGTSDGRGHGPDIGSSEWRSVVEFKLGVREHPEIPKSGSQQWCNFINQIAR